MGALDIADDFSFKFDMKEGIDTTGVTVENVVCETNVASWDADLENVQEELQYDSSFANLFYENFLFC